MSNRRLIYTIIISLLVISSFLLLPTRRASAKNVAFQTWPTRTPTPGSAPPTDTPTGGNGSPPPSTSTPEPGGTPGPGVTPSNTPEPGTTATPTATLGGGILPTVDLCGLPPTVLALGVVNVRIGPGIGYQPIGQLVYLEVQPIIGRSEFSPWWLIRFVDGRQGWVANQAVTVQGYTGFVPIVPPPLIGGTNPTPGTPWNPTPNPICTPPPTLSSTQIPNTPDPSGSPVATLPPPVESNPGGPTDNLVPTVASQPIPSPTSAPPQTVTVVSEPTDTLQPGEPTTETEITQPAPSDAAATNKDGEPTSSGGVSWILYAGAGLVVVGLLSFLVLRRSA